MCVCMCVCVCVCDRERERVSERFVEISGVPSKKTLTLVYRGSL